MTVGPGEKAQEILEESLSPISDALRIRPETSKILSVCYVSIAQLSKLLPWMPNLMLDIAICSQLLQCLAVITFVGGEDPEQTEKSMHIMWQVAHPKLGANVCILSVN